MNYELHPLCTLFPRMDGEAFATLVADIKANGLNEPITLHDGMILDGGNRYRACVAAGINPIFDEFAGKNPVTFVLSANLHRRHLTASQSAAIVSAAQDWAKAQNVGNPQFGNVTGLQTVADRAALSGASDKTQRNADKVAKADPKLAVKVAHGETTLAKAVEKVTGKKRAPAHSDEPDAQTINKELATAADELRVENETLKAQNDALIASMPENDLRVKVAQLTRLMKHAQHEQGNAMDRAAGYQKREKYAVDMCRQCARAVGVKDASHTDLRDIVKAVKAYVEAHA